MNNNTRPKLKFMTHIVRLWLWITEEEEEEEEEEEVWVHCATDTCGEYQDYLLC